MKQYLQCVHILLLGVALVGGQVAAQQRQERIFGSSSGSSVIVVYKKDHDKDNASPDRSEAGTGGLRDVGPGDSRDFRALRPGRDPDQRDLRDRDGRKVDVELRKDHGIKIFSTDDERDVRQDHSRHDSTSRDDHHRGPTLHKGRDRDGGSLSHPQQQHSLHQLHRKDDRRPGTLDDRR